MPIERIDDTKVSTSTAMRTDSRGSLGAGKIRTPLHSKELKKGLLRMHWYAKISMNVTWEKCEFQAIWEKNHKVEV